MTDDKTKGMDYPYVDDRVASLSALIAELRVRVNVLDVQMVAIHEAHPETASRLSPAEQKRYRRIRENLPETYPETATVPFDERGRCDHYNAERDTCAVQKLHVGFVSDTGSCFLSKGCEHRQVETLEQDDDPLKPVRKVADIRECSNCETLAADRGELRDMIANLYSALTRKDPGQGYLTYDNLKGCCRNPSHDECDAICKFLREARALLKRLGGGNDAQTQPCPHCGDTSQDPGHFDDCPDRKTEAASSTGLGPCDHYNADNGRCALDGSFHGMRDDGYCAASRFCKSRQIDGKADDDTPDKGGD